MAPRKKPAQRSEEHFELTPMDLPEKYGPALLFTEIDADAAMDVVQWIITMNMVENPPKVLTLLINSEGGDLTAGMAIVEAITASKIPVKTVGIGQVQSAGLLIFMSGAKGMRTITPSCMAMTHHFNTGSEGSYSELKNLQKEYDRLDKLIIQHYVTHTGLDEKMIRKFLVTDHDIYLSPEQVVQYNLADQIGPLEF
jgi:ATP-dependent Clp protease protease subunit